MQNLRSTPEAERLLQAAVAELDIGEARYEQAARSYASLGDWLHRPDSTVKAFKPRVYVQGSFGLGTVIKPITELEDYDVDSVCEFELLSVGKLTQEDLKRRLGVEVRSYRVAKNMTKPVREGRRCWVLDYADGAQFHMDIVPAVSDATRQRVLLEQAGYNAKWTTTAIAITDNERWNYKIISDDWCRSNPKGYIAWFRERMQFELRRRYLAEAAKARVEDIPDYRVRTPLQAAIMLLKRHRDLRFATDQAKLKPISIILTTLAGHAYQGQDSIADALVSILSGMDEHIKMIRGQYVIANPTDPMENFADKWAEFPERGEAFFAWLNQARSDFAALARASEDAFLIERANTAIGSGLAQRAAQRRGSGGGMLRAASSAPSGQRSFSNTPRVPTDPKGFA